MVVQTTKLFLAVERKIGFNNVVYVLTIAWLAYDYDDYRIFLAATSFVHYLRYITTYFYRSGVAFEAFMRDVLFFKSLALAQVRR